MTNQEIAKMLQETALLLDMQGVAFKPRAFEQASISINNLQISYDKTVIEDDGDIGLEFVFVDGDDLNLGDLHGC